MLAIGKVRLTDPGRPFATHMRHCFVELRINRDSHCVATNPGESKTALGYFCRSVVRTAGAVIGWSSGRVDCKRQRVLFRIQKVQSLFDQIDQATEQARIIRERAEGEITVLEQHFSKRMKEGVMTAAVALNKKLLGQSNTARQDFMKAHLDEVVKN